MDTRDGQPCEVIILDLATLSAYTNRRWKVLTRTQADHMQRIIDYRLGQEQYLTDAVQRLRVEER